MNSEEIKYTTTMYDVLGRYGLKADRGGMLSCPFHGADRHASMKIYNDGYHCFACGAHGDIFAFVMEYEGVSFKDAFQILGGTYASADPKERKKASITVKRRKLQAESRKLKEKRKDQDRRQLYADITKYRKLLQVEQPTTDIWADHMLKLCDLLQRLEWADTYEL